MLLCKILLRKFIHEVTIDCSDNYSDLQQNYTCKCSKTINARGAREIAFAAIFISQIICWMFHLKQTTFCIIEWRMTAEKGARAVGILRQGTGIRQVSGFLFFFFFFWKCLQIPVPCWQMSQLTINQTEIIFRSPGFSDAGIQRSVAYTYGQRNRYVLL